MTRSDPMKMNQSTEDYLEAVLMVQQEKGSCRSVDVANKLGFKKSSVSIAITKLTNEGYLNRGEKGKLILTDSGYELASKILERHNFFKNWLISLGIDDETAYDDACRMEHAMTEKSFRAIKKYVEER